MDKLIGVWKVNSMLMPTSKGPKKDTNLDEEMARMRYIFNEDGTVDCGFKFPGEITEDVLEEAKEHDMTIKDGIIITEVKKWSKKDDKYYSEISGEAVSENEINNNAEIIFEDGMLKVNAVFTYVYLEKE